MKQFFSNMLFIIKRMKSNVKGFILSIILEILFSLFFAYGSLLLTQTIINSISMKVEIQQYIQTILIGVFLIFIIRILYLYFNKTNEFYGAMLRMKEIHVPNQGWLYHDYQYFDDKSFTELSAKAIDIVSSDSSVFQTIPNHLKTFLEDLVKIMLFVSLLSVLDPLFILLLLLLLVVVGIYRVFQKQVIKKKLVRFYQYQDQVRYIDRVTKNFNIAKDIRLYQVKPWFVSLFDEVSLRIRKINMERGLVVLGGQLLSGFLILLLTGYGYTLLIQRLFIHDLNLGQLLFYIGALTTLAQSSTNLINSVFDLIEDNDQIIEYRKFLDYPPMFNHHKGQPIPQTIETIEFKNVSFKYPQSETYQFQDFNLLIQKNQKVAIVGLNGAGKTTLIKLLCNLYKPESGQILINGIDNQQFNVLDYYQLFSVVFQDQFKLPFALKEMIVQSSAFDESKYQQVIQDANLQKIIDQLPLKDDTILVKGVVENGVELSGGQLQKVKFAQALYKDGPILILDEPTSALDPLAESEVYQHYHQFSQNKLALFITHRLATTQFCERILYLEDGKVIEDGTHQQLMNLQGKYYEMYQKQAYYYQKEVHQHA